MNAFYIICTILFILIHILQLVIMFALWRAILGKSSIDARMGTQMSILSKSLDKFSNTIDMNTQKQLESNKHLKEVARTLKELKSDEQKN